MSKQINISTDHATKLKKVADQLNKKFAGVPNYEALSVERLNETLIDSGVAIMIKEKKIKL